MSKNGEFPDTDQKKPEKDLTYKKPYDPIFSGLDGGEHRVPGAHQSFDEAMYPPDNK